MLRETSPHSTFYLYIRGKCLLKANDSSSVSNVWVPPVLLSYKLSSPRETGNVFNARFHLSPLLNRFTFSEIIQHFTFPFWFPSPFFILSLFIPLNHLYFSFIENMHLNIHKRINCNIIKINMFRENDFKKYRAKIGRRRVMRLRPNKELSADRRKD